MGRPIGTTGQQTFAAIRSAGLSLIYEHGYEGMNLRQLAAKVGIRAGSLYNHISTKQQLLCFLIQTYLEELNDAMTVALEGLNDPVDRLSAFVRTHIEFNAARKKELFIANFELRSLESKNYAKIVRIRTTYDRMLNDILDQGVKNGKFHTSDNRITTFALISMLTGLCTWYRPNGRLSQKEITNIFIKIAQGAVSPTHKKSF